MMKNDEKRENIKELIITYNTTILDLTEEAIALSNEYIQKGAIPRSELEDAYHIAIATTHKIECLASWNFKHIVSVNPIRKVHEINLKNKFEIIEIGSLEVYGGYKYGNL